VPSKISLHPVCSTFLATRTEDSAAENAQISASGSKGGAKSVSRKPVARKKGLPNDATVDHSMQVVPGETADAEQRSADIPTDVTSSDPSKARKKDKPAVEPTRRQPRRSATKKNLT
jgi:hypothetical protein